MAKTTHDEKIIILADLWLNHRYNEELEDFVYDNDLGLPLAYALHEGIIKEKTELLTNYIDLTFENLLERFDVKDTGFEMLLDIVDLD